MKGPSLLIMIIMEGPSLLIMSKMEGSLTFDNDQDGGSLTFYDTYLADFVCFMYSNNKGCLIFYNGWNGAPSLFMMSTIHIPQLNPPHMLVDYEACLKWNNEMLLILVICAQCIWNHNFIGENLTLSKLCRIICCMTTILIILSFLFR